MAKYQRLCFDLKTYYTFFKHEAFFNLFTNIYFDHLLLMPRCGGTKHCPSTFIILIDIGDCLSELSSPLFPQSPQRTQVGVQFAAKSLRSSFFFPPKEPM